MDSTQKSLSEMPFSEEPQDFLIFQSTDSKVRPKPLIMSDYGMVSMAIFPVVLSVFAFSLIFYQTPSSFAVVDTHALIHESSKQLVKESPGGTVDPRRLRQAVERIHASLGAWAYAHHTILFAKGTVWGESLQDVTEQILNDFKEVR